MDTAKTVSVRAVIDEANNRVLFVEAGHDFVDILFSFLTMPMGEIIRVLQSRKPPKMGIGCMDNIYRSVKNLDLKHFRSETCKTMLLQPRNGAFVHCSRLKLKLDSGESSKRFEGYKLLSYYRNVTCLCGLRMDCEFSPGVKKDSDSGDCGCGGVFVKGLMTSFVVSDQLEVLNMLGFSLVSKTVLAHTLLQLKITNPPEACTRRADYSDQGGSINHRRQHQEPHLQQKHELPQRDGTNICVALVISKSKQMVCYAEVGEDFVNMLFSFLTVPLGHILKEMGSSGGTVSLSEGLCIGYLHKSVQDIDPDTMTSNVVKDKLLSPGLPIGFGYEKQLLGVEEVEQKYHYRRRRYCCYGKGKPTNESTQTTVLTIRDPKSPNGKEDPVQGGGFLKGPAMFTITDNLNITPISPVSTLSIMKKLNVHFEDVEKLRVYIGKK
ncbi:hypothetical protein Tsubulata_027991, partial [Turnera subulata]